MPCIRERLLNALIDTNSSTFRAFVLFSQLLLDSLFTIAEPVFYIFIDAVHHGQTS